MSDITAEPISTNGSEPDEAAIYIDGQGYAFDDLTFEEQGMFRRWLREDIAPPSACRPCKGDGVIKLTDNVVLCPRCGGEGEIDETREADYAIALITVIKRRSEPQFTIEDARRYRPADMKAPKVPPT